jgi:hypothetical protein
LTGQSLDITGLAAGKYRFSVTADANHLFYEKSTTNNTNWIDFKLGYTAAGKAGVQVISGGPLP